MQEIDYPLDSHKLFNDSSCALTLTERILGGVQTTGPSNSEVQITLYSISTWILIKLSVIKVKYSLIQVE